MIKKIWEYEIPEHITRFTSFDRNLIVVSSKFRKGDKYYQTISSHDPEYRKIRWEKEIIISDDSQCEFLISNGELFCIFDKYFAQIDPVSGGVTFEYDLGSTAGSVIISYEDIIVLTTIDGNIYKYDITKRTCLKAACLSSIFHWAVRSGDLIYALSRQERRLWGANLRSKYMIQMIDLKNFSVKRFLNVGKRPVGLWPLDLDKDLTVEVNGNIKRFGLDSREKWCYSTNTNKGQLSFVQCHGKYGDCVLFSRGCRLFLLNLENGEDRWTGNLSGSISSAILLENNMVIFSTAGGNLAKMMYGVIPENYIGIYTPKTNVEKKIRTISEIRIDLQKANNKIIAHYGFENGSKFLGFCISL